MNYDDPVYEPRQRSTYAAHLWTRASVPATGVVLAPWPTRWDGVPVGDDVTLEVWLGPKRADGAQYFRCFLTSQLGAPVEPVVVGVQQSGFGPAQQRVEVLEYRAELYLEDGQSVEVPVGIEKRIFQCFADAVAPGGSLLAEYDSPARWLTAQALSAQVPPLATPLGATLRAAGCGDWFRDLYTAEGGRQGPRMLQGGKAADTAHARRRGLEMLAELRAFLAGGGELDWGLQAKCRPLADAAIEELSILYEG